MLALKGVANSTCGSGRSIWMSNPHFFRGKNAFFGGKISYSNIRHNMYIYIYLFIYLYLIYNICVYYYYYIYILILLYIYI